MSETFDTVRILIDAKRRQQDGALFTSHRPATDGDRDRLAKWPSGGLVQIAHALFIEYLRREAYAMVTVMISQGAKPEELSSDDVREKVRMQIHQMLDYFAEGAVEEAIGRAREAL